MLGSENIYTGLRKLGRLWIWQQLEGACEP
jgi:hypothetical protein